MIVHVVRSLWIWTVTALLVVGWVPLLGIVRAFDREPQHRRTARWFRRLGRAVAKVNPWRLHITGREHIDPSAVYVVVSNHQSFADIPVISHLRLDAKWLAKAQLFRVPFLGWMMRMAGDVPVDRADRRRAAQALLQCARYLRQRVSIVFFPEGTRSPDGRVLPFNDGPFQLALRENVPVLPLVVEGSGSALPRSSWLFGGTTDIYLRVLEPVRVEGWDPKKTTELKEIVRQRIIDELGKLRGSSGALPTSG